MFLSNLGNGSSVFIDANIFVYHFSKKSNFNLSCTEFLVRIEEGEIEGITSTSVVQEVTHRMMIVEASSLFPDIKAKDLVRYLKGHPNIIKKLATHREIPSKIVSFNLEIVSIDIQVLDRSPADHKC